MSYEKMNFLLSLATEQKVEIVTVREFAEFACRVKL